MQSTKPHITTHRLWRVLGSVNFQEIKTKMQSIFRIQFTCTCI